MWTGHTILLFYSSFLFFYHCVGYRAHLLFAHLLVLRVCIYLHPQNHLESLKSLLDKVSQSFFLVGALSAFIVTFSWCSTLEHGVARLFSSYYIMPCSALHVIHVSTSCFLVFTHFKIADVQIARSIGSRITSSSAPSTIVSAETTTWNYEHDRKRFLKIWRKPIDREAKRNTRGIAFLVILKLI